MEPYGLEPYGVLPTQYFIKTYWESFKYKKYSKTKAIQDIYECIKKSGKYIHFNNSVIINIIKEYIIRLQDIYFISYDRWYLLYMNICVKNTHLLIQLKIIKSRKIIRKFIKDHINNLKYKISRKDNNVYGYLSII